MGIENEKKWQELIQQRKDSGLSAKVWCSQNNIKLSTFKYWDYKFKKNNRSDTSWAKLTLPSVESYNIKAHPTPFILSINDVSISIPVSFDKETLAELLSVLRMTC